MRESGAMLNDTNGLSHLAVFNVIVSAGTRTAPCWQIMSPVPLRCEGGEGIPQALQIRFLQKMLHALVHADAIQKGCSSAPQQQT